MNPLVMALIMQPRLAAVPAAPDPVQPTLGTITPYVRADSSDTLQINFEHTTATGNFIVLGGWRSNGNPSGVLTGITADTTPINIVDTQVLDGSQRGGVFGAWYRGATPGVVPLQANWDRANSRRHIIWVIDVFGMRQGPGSPIGGFSPRPLVLNADAASIATTIAAINAASRLVGIGGMIATLDPYTVTNATKIDTDRRSGNSTPGVHNSACLWDVELDATGDRTVTVTSAGEAIEGDRYAFGMELLPS